MGSVRVASGSQRRIRHPRPSRVRNNLQVLRGFDALFTSFDQRVAEDEEVVADLKPELDLDSVAMSSCPFCQIISGEHHQEIA